MGADIGPLANARLALFFELVAGLSRAELRLVEREGGRTALSRVAFRLDPDVLAAVASGAWTPAHASLAEQAGRQARACARQRVSPLRRRRVARVLEGAALVVLNDSDPAHPLPPRLCRRLAGPWTRATGLALTRPEAA